MKTAKKAKPTAIRISPDFWRRGFDLSVIASEGSVCKITPKPHDGDKEKHDGKGEKRPCERKRTKASPSIVDSFLFTPRLLFGIRGQRFISVIG
jgi:hypothetical protein